MSDHTAIKAKFEAAGQGHVFTYYAELSPDQQQDLLSQLSKIDPVEVNGLYSTAINAANSEVQGSIEPLPAQAFDSAIASPEKIPEWEKVGMDLISKNKVAVLLLAGGQGTRLGSSAPKGCYNIGLPSEKSLFQLQAERIRRLEALAQNNASSKVVIPWYIMTSGPTRSATEEFFKSNDYFGFHPDNVIFFNQGTLPCLTNEGKIILEDKSKVFPILHQVFNNFRLLLLPTATVASILPFARRASSPTWPGEALNIFTLTVLTTASCELPTLFSSDTLSARVPNVVQKWFPKSPLPRQSVSSVSKTKSSALLNTAR